MALETVICTFRVRPGNESTFEALLDRHWPTLHRIGLVTDRPPLRYCSVDDEAPTYVEIFEWVDGGADLAHHHTDVMALWEPMEQACESRDGRPPAEFPHFRPFAGSGRRATGSA